MQKNLNGTKFVKGSKSYMVNKLLLKLKSIQNFIISNKFCVFIIFYTAFLIILSFFRNATADETVYLLDSLLMSNLLKKGIWFGDYGVGLHGFLFKLPVALIFMITGPSVFAATLFNIIIMVLSLIIYYQILKDQLRINDWALYSTILLASSYYFVQVAPTYLRDGPMLFSLLLFIKYFLRKKNSFILGLLAMVVLDAKEYTFFILFSAYLIWLFYVEVILNKKKLFEKIAVYIKTVLIFMLPASLYLLLMFCTSIIPLNMFTAYILGIINNGYKNLLSQFEPTVTTLNLLDNTKKAMPLIIHKSRFPILNILFTILNFILKYIGKIIYPRTFSFISVPLIIVIPSVTFSVLRFKNWFRKKQFNFLFLLIFFWTGLLIYILRASHGRYLLQINPIIFYLFVIYIKSKDYKNFRLGTYLSLPFVILSFFFEKTFIPHKIIFNLIILLSIYFAFTSKKSSSLVRKTALLIISACLISPMLAFSYYHGQIGSFLKWGYNQDAKRIASNISSSDTVLINNFGSANLYSFYAKNFYIEPEWHWQLRPWIPKKHLLITFGEQNIFYFDTYNNINDFKKQINQNKINKVIIITSTKPGIKFFMQDKIGEFSQLGWLKLENKISLKNKNVYVFDISY
jgi:hypothetical protein